MAKPQSVDVLVALDESSDEPLYRQIYDAMRRAICEGRLREGDKLPSIRGLCRDLGVSHTTAEQAYLQLQVEGYVRSVPRSGYVVERLDAEFLALPNESTAPEVERVMAARSALTFSAGHSPSRGVSLGRVWVGAC